MLLEAIARHAKEHPEKTAYQNSKEKLSYRQLWEDAQRLSVWLRQEDGPVMICGEKECRMPIAFLACLMAGRAYLPVDIHQPAERIERIRQQANVKTVLNCTDSITRDLAAVSVEKILTDCHVEEEVVFPTDQERDAYWLFTSGSTGIPKGVRISVRALENFVHWILSLPAISDCAEGVTVNQAQFFFDLSVADLWPCWAAGGTVYALERGEQEDLSRLYQILQHTGGERLTVTPSFLRLCLCDSTFCRETMPQLKTVFLCGETLASKTVRSMRERFPGVRMINAYGPTEATCAVCAVEIQDMEGELPIGEMASSACRVMVLNENKEPLPDGSDGEIAISGKSVGNGYVGGVTGGFGSYQREPLYCTGDAGVIRDGLLWYRGRIDRQIKYKGYRIEPGEIESALLSWKEVLAAAVLPVRRNGEVRGLTAVIEWDGEPVSVSECRSRLSGMLPHYMQPRSWKAIEKMPMNSRGKCDFHALERMLENESNGFGAGSTQLTGGSLRK